MTISSQLSSLSPAFSNVSRSPLILARTRAFLLASSSTAPPVSLSFFQNHFSAVFGQVVGENAQRLWRKPVCDKVVSRPLIVRATSPVIRLWKRMLPLVVPVLTLQTVGLPLVEEQSCAISGVMVYGANPVVELQASSCPNRTGEIGEEFEKARLCVKLSD